MPRIEFRHDHSLDSDSPLNIYVWPDVTDAYVIGADVAEGLEHGDWSVAQVLSVRTGDQVAKYRSHVDADTFGERIAELGWYYNCALVGVESNNHGLTTITTLRHIGYPNVWRRRTLNQVWDTQTVEYGWKTTRTSKPLMIDELNQALRDREVHVYDQGTVGELRTFVRDEKGLMHGSPHDDEVMALAVANQMRKYAHLAESMVHTSDEYTLNWWVRQAKELDRPQGEWGPIGHHNTRR